MIRRPFGRGLLEERLDGERGVDEHRLAGLLVPDQVRRAAEVVVDELAQEHAPERTTGPCCTS